MNRYTITPDGGADGRADGGADGGANGGADGGADGRADNLQLLLTTANGGHEQLMLLDESCRETIGDLNLMETERKARHSIGSRGEEFQANG